MWEYYFEPVSDYKPGMPGYDVRSLPSKTLWTLHEQSETSVFAYPSGRYNDKRGASHVDGWYNAMRSRAHDGNACIFASVFYVSRVRGESENICL